MDIQTLEVNKINPAVYNPRKDLQPGDIEYDKLKKSILEFDMVEPLVWNKRTGNLVGGHQRLKILKELGIENVEVSVVDLSEVKEKALNLALNKIQGEWDLPRLKDLLEELDTGDFDIEVTGFDFQEIEGLMTQNHPAEEDSAVKPVETLQLIPSDVIKSKLDAADHIIYLYSGGKDSGLTIASTIENIDRSKVRALYIDTGAEFPDLELFCRRFCKAYSLSLDVLRPEKGWFELFEPLKIFPDPVYRECIGKLIVEPAKEYIRNLGGDSILIYGGRRGQRVRRAQNSYYADFKDEKNLWSPLYNMPKDEFTSMLEGQPMWPGYKEGMERTACWCCPFQKAEQWEAMRSQYRGLWDAMEIIVREFRFKYHKQELSTIKSLYSYWPEHFTNY